MLQSPSNHGSVRLFIVLASVLVTALPACGTKKDEGPMVAPTLSADGKVVVPEGHETTYLFGDTPVRLHYTWLDVTKVDGHPSVRIHAKHGRLGMLTMTAPIPEGTQQLAQMKGVTVSANHPGSVSFGVNTPEMATGVNAAITIDDVTPTYVTGHFESQACPFGKERCDRPTPVTKGVFKAFRSALSDDAAFTRAMTQP